MPLLRLLGLGTPDQTEASAGLSAAVRERLAHLPPARAEFTAAFAGLLMRVAHADSEVSPEEDAALRRLVDEHAGLTAEECEAVAALVTAHLESMAGIDYAELTRTMNTHASKDEKLHLIDCLYAVATADDLVSVVEDEEVKAVARALMLSHRELIEVRRRYSDQLEVIRAARKLQ